MRRILERLRRLLRAAQTAWSILGVTLLLILVCELGLRGFFWLKDRGRQRIPPDPRVLAQIKDSAGWLPQHYRELEAISDRWQPYVYFRQRPFRGQTITVDDEGLRRTWKPTIASGASNRSKPPIRILMLGGSSLWGFGARDDETIPSWLARELDRQGIPAEIRNLAEIGYVNTQELVALMRELQSGYRPDVVVCYDGVNDTTAALLAKEATVTTNEVNRVREFNILQSPARLSGALLGNLVENSALFRLASSVGKRVGPRRSGAPAPLPKAELSALALQVVRGYTANVRMIERLGQSYGFRPLFVWQPVIFSKAEMVPFEREESAKFEWTEDFFREVHRALVLSADLMDETAFEDLSGLFVETNALVFLDFCHTTEEANARIGKLLAARLQERGMVRAGHSISAGQGAPRSSFDTRLGLWDNRIPARAPGD